MKAMGTVTTNVSRRAMEMTSFMWSVSRFPQYCDDRMMSALSTPKRMICRTPWTFVPMCRAAIGTSPSCPIMMLSASETPKEMTFWRMIGTARTIRFL